MGGPISFQCSKCRRNRRWALSPGEPLYDYYNDRGRVDRVVLTGRTRRRHKNPGSSHGLTLFEYRCGDCGHLGWSSHYDLEQFGREEQDTK